MIDVLAIRRKRINIPNFAYDMQLTCIAGLACVAQEDVESMILLAPMKIDGSFHSDVASVDNQPSLLNRIKELPRHYAPHGLSDDDIINSCGSRSLHDIADIDNVSKDALNTAINRDSAFADDQDGSGKDIMQGVNDIANSSDTAGGSDNSD